jgi:MFS family permease
MISFDEANIDHDTGSKKLGLTYEAQQDQIEKLAQEYGVDHKKLMYKVDWHIVPAICMLYLLAFLDRVNISNANVYGMSKQIGLIGNQYNICLTVFFVPYVVCEVPSNVLLKKFKPHAWLSFCMVCFGVVSIGQGFVANYGGLITTRILLGVFESGMFPGCFYLLSMWYRRDEAQTRYSFFFASTSLAGAFGGLIAYGVNHINGSHGLEGWRWLFIIEGALTAFIAFILFWCLSDFPENSSLLNENERAFLKAKLALDVGDSCHGVNMTRKDVLEVFKEWKVWVAGFMYFGLIIPAYGYAYFANAIIASFKYTPVQTQLHSIPPWVVSFGMGMIIAAFSDRVRHRYLFTVGTSLISVAGFAMLLANHHSIHVRYAACFLVAAGMYTAMPLILCWTSMNFAGHHRRAVGTGWLVGFGNTGGIIATFSFLAHEAPYYTKGLAICLAFVCFSMLSSTIYFFGIRYENRARRLGKENAAWEELSPEKKAFAGDLSIDFVYGY